MSELDDLRKEAVERIYLIPDRDEGRPCYLWCEDPAPGQGMKEEEAVEYIRADIAEQQLNAERERADALAAHVEQMKAIAVDLANVVENRDELPLHKWALKCARLVPQIHQSANACPENSLAQIKATVATDAFKAGFKASAEGFNGEYPTDATSENGFVDELTDYLEEIAARGGHE